ncbi:MAG: PilZ domain-containing protein [Rhodospirillales bacterium]
MAKGKSAKERRRHSRAKTPEIIVAIDDGQFGADNLSLGGVLVENYDGPLTTGAPLTITGIGPSESTMAPVAIRARVNRADPGARQLALTFLNLDASAYEILQVAMARKAEGG